MRCRNLRLYSAGAGLGSACRCFSALHSLLICPGRVVACWMHFVMMQFGVMQIFVKMPSGKTITLGVGASETIATLKIIIADKEGIPPEQQLLTCAGQVLGNWGTWAAHDIQNEWTLHCALCLRGGGGGMQTLLGFALIDPRCGLMLADAA